VLGVLGALLVMSVVYALSLNQVNSNKTDIARAKSEIEQAKAQVAASAEFGDFHSVKETREASVKQLASGRFDFERLMRELALVLPAHTWLLDASTSTTGADSGAPGAATPPPPAAGAPAATTTDSAGAAGTNPTLNLSGCALKQNNVAVLLVRLRKLYRAEDVDLEESAEDTTDQGGARAQTSSDSAGAGEESCGAGRFKFTVHVKFSASPDGEKPHGGKVPAKLGGGS
jgi:Tfp pilus assembly protein PilN